MGAAAGDDARGAGAGAGVADGDACWRRARCCTSIRTGTSWSRAATEAVLAVTPRSREEALRVAFEVGNRHFTLAVDGERLLVPDDPAMEQLLAAAGRWRSSGRGRCSCRWARGIVMTDAALLALLQFADGLFPAGGFAHSFGLETYVQEGGVRDRARAGGVRRRAPRGLGRAGRRGGGGGGRAPGRRRRTSARWVALDARLDAMKACRSSARRAARWAGRRCAWPPPSATTPCSPSSARAVDDGLAPGHHAAVFGAALGRARRRAGGGGGRVSVLDGGAAGGRRAAADRPRTARRPARAGRDAAADRAAGGGRGDGAASTTCGASTRARDRRHPSRRARRAAVPLVSRRSRAR